ncbi:hypothetical protein ACH3XW_5860 [Acanthocheilonema viteae]
MVVAVAAGASAGPVLFSYVGCERGRWRSYQWVTLMAGSVESEVSGSYGTSSLWAIIDRLAGYTWRA